MAQRWQIKTLTEPVVVPSEVQEGAQPPSVEVFFPATTQYPQWSMGLYWPLTAWGDYTDYPDYLFKRPSNNVGDSAFLTPLNVFVERPQVDKFGPQRPDVLFKKPPNNLGDSLFWSGFTPVVLTPVPPPVQPDTLFREPPNNVSESVFWDPNILFPEAVSIDRFQGSKPDLLFRRTPNNVGESEFGSAFTPPSYAPINLFVFPDLLPRRPSPNAADSIFMDPNVQFPEVTSVDRWLGSKPDVLFRRTPNNAGDSFFWGTTTPASFTPIGASYGPDVLSRRTPARVGESQFWVGATPAVYPVGSHGAVVITVNWVTLYPMWATSYVVSTPYTPINLTTMPDLLSRRPPNNLGGSLAWDPNVLFSELVSLDRFAPVRPDLLYRRAPDNVGESDFWSGFTPSVFTPYDLVSMPDVLFRRFPNNVGESESWDPNINFPERVQLDKFKGMYPDLLFRRGLPNVGPFLSWSNFTPAVFTPVNLADYPDLLFRRLPPNAGPSHLWDPNTIFGERLTMDKWWRQTSEPRMDKRWPLQLYTPIFPFQYPALLNKLVSVLVAYNLLGLKFTATNAYVLPRELVVTARQALQQLTASQRQQSPNLVAFLKWLSGQIKG